MTVPKDQAVLETSIGALLDDGEFHKLHRRLGRFNLFEAVGGVRAEIRHSNFLGFVFSPNRSHGLGSVVLERTLRAILELMPLSDPFVRPAEGAEHDMSARKIADPEMWPSQVERLAAAAETERLRDRARSGRLCFNACLPPSRRCS